MDLTSVRGERKERSSRSSQSVSSRTRLIEEREVRVRGAIFTEDTRRTGLDDLGPFDLDDERMLWLDPDIGCEAVLDGPTKPHLFGRLTLVFDTAIREPNEGRPSQRFLAVERDPMVLVVVAHPSALTDISQRTPRNWFAMENVLEITQGKASSRLGERDVTESKHVGERKTHQMRGRALA